MVLQLSQALEGKLAAAAGRRGVSVEALAHERSGRVCRRSWPSSTRVADAVAWAGTSWGLRPAAGRGEDDLIYVVHYPVRSATMAVIGGWTAAVRGGGATPASGQWRAMPDGIDGIHGIGGNLVSVSYRF